MTLVAHRHSGRGRPCLSPAPPVAVHPAMITTATRHIRWFISAPAAGTPASASGDGAAAKPVVATCSYRVGDSANNH